MVGGLLLLLLLLLLEGLGLLQLQRRGRGRGGGIMLKDELMMCGGVFFFLRPYKAVAQLPAYPLTARSPHEDHRSATRCSARMSSTLLRSTSAEVCIGSWHRAEELDTAASSSGLKRPLGPALAAVGHRRPNRPRQRGIPAHCAPGSLLAPARRATPRLGLVATSEGRAGALEVDGVKCAVMPSLITRSCV